MRMLRDRIRLIYAALRGQPIIYGLDFIGPVNVNDCPRNLLVMYCHFRGDDSGNGGLRVK